MSFLLLLFFATILVNLSYILLQRIVKYLSKKIPNICESILLRLQKRNQQTQEEEEEEGEGNGDAAESLYDVFSEEREIKTLERKSVKNVSWWRKRVSLYIDRLSEGRGTKVEQSLWKVYERYVPQQMRFIDTELGVESPLPAWLEWTIRAYYNPYIWRSTQILALYVILVFTAHFWLPYVGLLQGNTLTSEQVTQETLFRLYALNISNCLVAQTDKDYCFISPSVKNEQLRNQSLEKDTRISPATLAAYFLNQSSHRTSLFLRDERGSVYAAFNLLRKRVQSLAPWFFTMTSSSDSDESNANEETTLIERQFLDIQEEVLPLLREIQAEEDSQRYLCLCPPLLNFLGNMTFLFDKSLDEWTILFEPVIVRNNTFSDLVLSSVKYNEKSRFFLKDGAFKSQFPRLKEETMHHDSFVVEYSDAPDLASLEMLERLSEANVQLQGKERLYTHFDNQVVRKRVHLSENDAICFVYCNTLNEALLFIH